MSPFANPYDDLTGALRLLIRVLGERQDRTRDEDVALHQACKVMRQCAETFKEPVK